MFNSLANTIGVLFESNLGEIASSERLRVLRCVAGDNILIKLLVNCYRFVSIQYYKIIVHPQFTISHLEGPNFLNLMTRFGGYRIIFVHNVVTYNYRERCFTNTIKKRLISLLYYRADLVVAVSSEVLEDLVTEYNVPKDRISVLPNPIDSLSIQNKALFGGSEVLDKLSSFEYIVCVASLTKQKNHELLLEIYRDIIECYPSMKLVLVGDGPERSRIVECCKKLGLEVGFITNGPSSLECQVIVAGFQENPYPIIKHAKLFVLPSRWEGQPIAIMEAMCLGVPIVVSNSSPAILQLVYGDEFVPELEGAIKIDYGYLVVSANNSEKHEIVQGWSRSIASLLDDKTQYNQVVSRCKQRAKDFDIGIVSEEWEKVMARF